MSAYTTQAAIQAKVPPLILVDALDDDGDGDADAGLLDQIIANASNDVDAMICNRVALPLATVPASVSGAALWLAIADIYGRRQKEMPEDFKRRLRQVNDFLEKVRDGKEILDATATQAITSESGQRTYVPGRLEDLDPMETN